MTSEDRIKQLEAENARLRAELHRLQELRREEVYAMAMAEQLLDRLDMFTIH